MRQTLRGWAAVAAPCLLIASFPTPAAAIPSPELIIGSAASLSQIGALIAATFGGGALLARKGGQQQGRLQLLLIVGLMALVALLTFALVAQWTAQTSERQARLEANLLRPARQPGLDIDPELKELTFQEQVKHPLGLATVDAQRQIEQQASDPSLIVVDARNDAETEMGGIAASRIVKLGDFKADDPAHRGKRFIFYCHNGNRSYETCAAARAKGVDCRFVIGGLEKWVVEQRPLSGLQARTLADLRAIPDYPGRGQLLDTAQVKELIDGQGAQVVDVRYPADFAKFHMPYAVNITLRRMSRQELDQHLAKLDKSKPVVLPCYDRRSCFFADVMGLNLSRAGFAVAGRYTTPHEYFIPAPRPPHVEAWIADQNKSYWQRAREAVAQVLVWVAASLGLPLTLLLFAMASRLAVWPFTAKSERDQLVARATANEVAALKRRLADDPVRLRRAVFAHARRHNLTPGRNLLGLAFLPILALVTLAAGDAASATPSRWLWIKDLAQPDASTGLPLLVALTLTVYCVAVFATTQRQQVITALVGLPLLTFATAPMPAAASLYLLASALLMAAQRILVAGYGVRLKRAVAALAGDVRQRWLGGAQALALPLDASRVGNKAGRLSMLAAEGYPVPAGLVLDEKAVATLLSGSPREQSKRARRLARALGGKTFAVRSSGVGEDGAASSFAGVFESEINVPRDGLAEAIRRVAQSFHAERVRAYADVTPGDRAGGIKGNVLVQRMVTPDFAGVLFTRAPDAAGQMLVELVEGAGDALASGRRTPRTYRVGRVTREVIGEKPPIDLSPLIDIGQRLADRFERPQDIEWAYADGRFHLLQTRDIAAMPVDPIQMEHAESLVASKRPPPGVSRAGSDVLFRATTMAELLPRPTTLSLDLMNALWGPGGSVDHACRRLGLAYDADEDDPPQFTRINGRLVVDAQVESKRALRMTQRQHRRLLKSAATMHGDVTAALAQLRHDAQLAAALDLQKLSFVDLQALWGTSLAAFLTRAHPLAETVNILAELAVGSRDVEIGPSVRPQWHDDIVSATRLGERERTEAWRHIAGHRANVDYELAHPRWSEIPGAVDAFAVTIRARPARTPPEPGSLDALIMLKEDAKHEMLRAFANLRRLLLELDRRTGLGGHIFELTLEEVAALTPETGGATAFIARERRYCLQSLLAAPPPRSSVTARDLERLGTDAFAAALPLVPEGSNGSDGRSKGRGTRVSGRGDVTGRVYVASQAQAEAGLPLSDFRERDILVTPLVHPDWLAIVLKSGGVVSETGGWLSHMAIVAREHNISMVVGVPNAGQFRTGDRIRLMPDGRVIAEAEAGQKLALVAAK